jgi:hypothetical protein
MVAATRPEASSPLFAGGPTGDQPGAKIRAVGGHWPWGKFARANHALEVQVRMWMEGARQGRQSRLWKQQILRLSS